MSLKKLFNFAYLRENLKKSKVTLSFVLLILPILNLTIFLMSTDSFNVNIFDINNISLMAILGMYVLPIVLSYILFSYVFKKKSVDFMGSMPIGRKTIFFTNTLGGIIIILLLLLITSLLMGLVTLISSNIYVPVGVLIDYFVIFAISYVFVFTACNISVCVAGNIPTSLVVTMLILFFVPFNHFVYKNILIDNYSTDYELSYRCDDCDYDFNTKNIEDVYLYKKDKLANYTVPFQVLENILTLEDVVTYNSISLGKTVLLSLIYILVGSILFEKKEMEICETSFKSFKIHQVVKYLTFVPFLLIIYRLIDDISIFGLMFVIVVLLIYSFVYDLITRHSIKKIKSNLISFVLVFVLVEGLCFLVTSLNNHSKTISYNIDDITSVKVELSLFNYYSEGELITINDVSLRDKLIMGVANYTSSQEESYNDIDIVIEIGGNEFDMTSSLDNDVYDEVLSYIKNTKTYKKYSLKEKISNGKFITLDKDYIKLDDKGLDILNNSNLSSSVDDCISVSVYIYVYKNHKLFRYVFESSIDSKFNEYALSLYNSKAKDISFDGVYGFNITDYQKENDFYYVNATVDNKNKIKDIMKNDIDLEKDIYKITIFKNDKTYYYLANLSHRFFLEIDDNYIETRDEEDGY